MTRTLILSGIAVGLALAGATAAEAQSLPPPYIAPPPRAGVLPPPGGYAVERHRFEIDRQRVGADLRQAEAERGRAAAARVVADLERQRQTPVLTPPVAVPPGTPAQARAGPRPARGGRGRRRPDRPLAGRRGLIA
ncbi:hypothetical protein [Brevundimonas sp.]|uniref:hypothetical protein n=1 Tax=Brevundimonas sp. TaxID=1871086 RepID=UPI0035129699